MGLLNSKDWSPAKWIGLDGVDVTDYLEGTSWIWFPTGEPEQSAAPGTNYFRKVVVIPAGRRIIRAKFVYTGDNECRGWINGFDLGARNNFHTVKYNDITGAARTRHDQRVWLHRLQSRPECQTGGHCRPARPLNLIEASQ